MEYTESFRCIKHETAPEQKPCSHTDRKVCLTEGQFCEGTVYSIQKSLHVTALIF